MRRKRCNIGRFAGFEATTSFVVLVPSSGSYTVPHTSYTTDRCQAPRLRQGNFGDGSTPDVEEQVQPGDQQASSRAASPKCLPPLSTTLSAGGDFTPGILRPEEQHNTLGRCRHRDNRHHQIIDTACIDKLGRIGNLRNEHDLQSAAILVASPTSQAPFDKYEGHFAPNRYSTSSDSSYSSQGSDIEGDPLSTNRLIRYYTGYNDPNDDTLTRRNSRFSTVAKPWQLEEGIPVTSEPLRSQPTPERSRQGSAPPPYQPGSRKGSHGSPRYF